MEGDGDRVVLKGLQEDKVVDYLSRLIASVDPLSIPPDIEQLEEFRKATSTGYVGKISEGREPLSLQFKDNKPFKMLETTEKFSQMGFGYTYFFFFTKFVLLLGLFPLLPYSIIFMTINSSGRDCLSSTEFTMLKEKVLRLEDYPILYFHEPSRSVLDYIKSKTAPDAKVDKKLLLYQTMLCVVNSSHPDCKLYSEDSCFREYTNRCQNHTLDLYLSQYINQLCVRDGLTHVSAGNVVSRLQLHRVTRDVLDCLVFIVVTAMIYIFYYFHELRKARYKGWNPKIEGYTILLCGLIDAKFEFLEKRIEALFAAHRLTVRQVSLCFATKKYQKLLQDIAHLQEKRAIRRFQCNGNSAKESPSKRQQNKNFARANNRDNLQEEIITDSVEKGIVEKIREKEAEIQKFKESYKLQAQSPHFLGSAYVTVDSHEEKLKALAVFDRHGWLSQFLAHKLQSKYKKESLFLDHEGQKFVLWVRDAAAPHDIIWRDIETTAKSRLWRRAFAVFVTLVTIGINFYIILSVKFEGVKITQQRKVQLGLDHLPISYELAINLLVAVIIFLINQCMRVVLKKLSVFEKKYTFTSRELMITHKLWKIQFITAVLMPATAVVILMDFYGKTGFVNTMISVLAVYVVLPPMAYLGLDVMGWYKWCMRKRIKAFAKGENKAYITLEHAKAYWLKAEFVMSFCYSRVVRNFAICMFLLPIMPICVFFFLVMTFIFYWVNKYILVKRCNKLIGYSTKLCTILVDELELCVALFILGCAVRDFSVDYPRLGGVLIRPLHCVLIAIILIAHWLNLKRYLLRFLPVNEAPKVLYSELIRQDPNSYYLSNPAYNKEELTMGRRHRRMRQSHLASQIRVFVKPQIDLYELEILNKNMVNKVNPKIGDSEMSEIKEQNVEFEQSPSPSASPESDGFEQRTAIKSIPLELHLKVAPEPQPLHNPNSESRELQENAPLNQTKQDSGNFEPL